MTQDRRAAIDAYKSRPLNAGIFLVRCEATGAVWVGANADLDAARNALFFLLRAGTQRNPTLQAAWREHGEAAIRFDVVDVLDVDTPPAQVADELKRRQRDWVTRSHGEMLLR